MKNKKYSLMPETQITAAEFKAKCLQLMDDVCDHQRSFTVTKRGKPVARFVPVNDRPGGEFVGSLRGAVREGHRLASPTGERWEAQE